MIVVLALASLSRCPIPTPVPVPPTTTTTVPVTVPTPIPTPTPITCYEPIGEAVSVIATPTRLIAVDFAVGRVKTSRPDLFDGNRLRDWKEVSPQEQIAKREEFHALVMAELAANAICTTPWGDAIGVESDGLWEEYHIVNNGGGGIAEARFAYKGTFRYGLPTPTPTPPVAACPLDPTHDIRIKIDQRSGAAGARWIDVTYEYYYGVNPDGTNAGPCGDPTTGAPRSWCDIGVDGGPFGVICQNELVGDPTFAAIGGDLTLSPGFHDNANLAQVQGSGVAHVCASKRPAICADAVIG